MAPRPIEELVQLISEFPGLGPRQSRRIVQFLLSRNDSFIDRVSQLIREVKKNTVQCRECFRYDDASTKGLCRICADENRDTTLLMVVEKDVDIEGVEASGAYKGRYFVLGGLMSLVQKKNAPVLRTKELSARIQKDQINEVIFALSTTPEGDFTAKEIMSALSSSQNQSRQQKESPAPRLSLLARGLSVGAELEYADPETLRNAFQNRSYSEKE